MTTSSTAHSNAFNFLSFVQNSVDPRTGQYTATIDLPELKSNDLCGPVLPLQLAFNPLNILDSGFGRGWNLNLSQYTPPNSMLALSTGETFKVTGSGPQPSIREKKLDSFHFYNDGNDTYRVVHKSGLVEILQTLGSGADRVALPSRVCSPSGHWISLHYTSFRGQPCLASIKDASEQTLLQIDRSSDSSMVLQLHPFAGPGGTPLARFEVKLTDRHVREIVLPTAERASWRFDYVQVRGMTCIKEVQTPVGGRELVEYNDGGHAYPGNSGRQPLPRVTRHEILPGFDQPRMEARYTYTNENFLGNNSAISWSDDGLDNLYKVSGSYSYGSITEHLLDGRVVRSVVRHFNRFHLLTEETTAQDGCIQKVLNTYHALDVPFDQQPPYFQLPKTVEKRWALANDATRTRSEILTTLYDDHGNLLEELTPDGIRIVREYYPVDDSEGCPADPEGFVRNLRSQTVYPATGGEGQAPVLRTRYGYRQLPPVQGGIGNGWLLIDSETLVHIEGDNQNLLRQTERRYLDMPDRLFLHGRADFQTETLNGKTSRTEFRYSKVDGELGRETLQQTVETYIGFDRTQKTTTTAHSLFTGDLMRDENIHGVRTHYRYDALRRLVTETVAPDTEYVATRQYQYSLTSTDGQQATQAVTDVKGVTTFTFFDGYNRTLRQERETLDATGQQRVRHQTYAAQFDGLGRKTRETVFDQLDERSLALTSHFEYDAWGQLYKQTGPDGVAQFSEMSPFGPHGNTVSTWQENAEKPGVRTHRQVTQYNLFDKPVSVQRLDADGTPAGLREYFYTGLGSCTREVETLRSPDGQPTQNLQRTTRYEYDAWGRMQRTVLPNDSAIARTFAEHSRNELPTRLEVSPVNGSAPLPVCERGFDGLDRLTRLSVGPRMEQYRYDGEQVLVSQRITASNRTIKYNYRLALTTQPATIEAPDGSASYGYDRFSADITGTQNANGERIYQYTDQGHLKSEQWIDKDGQRQQSDYRTSLQGRQLSRSDSGGAPTQYDYDEFGRLRQVSQGNLKAEFVYNGDSLLAQSTSTDLASGRALVTDLEYDEHGREVLRTLRLDAGTVQTLTQVWRDDDQLHSRELQQDGRSRLLETFDYDALNRLTRHACEGDTLPTNAQGTPITQQLFRFDDLNNITQCVTTFDDGTRDTARFVYAEDGSFQLRSVTHTHPDYPAQQAFEYDADGHMLNDEQGRRLRYDSLGRLLEVRSANDDASLASYRYDGHDHLVGVRHGSASESLRAYQGYSLSSTLEDGVLTQYLYDGDRPLGQQQPGSPAQTRLLLTDAANSVIGESDAGGVQTANYSAYGERAGDNGLDSLLAFNGEARDKAFGWYLLGRGYRAYNPSLMRFHSPDSLSPEESGINPYLYCLGNPITWRDPTGHRADSVAPRRDPNPPYIDPPEKQKPDKSLLGGWLGTIVGAVILVVSIAASIYFTGGVTLPLVVGAGIQILGLGLQAASNLVQDPKVAEGLMYGGYAATVLGGIVVGFGATRSKSPAGGAGVTRKSVGTQTDAVPTGATPNLSRAGSSTSQAARRPSASDTGIDVVDTRGSVTPSIPSVDYDSSPDVLPVQTQAHSPAPPSVPTNSSGDTVRLRHVDVRPKDFPRAVGTVGIVTNAVNAFRVKGLGKILNRT
ncbi:RHS repeat domain-containing protein [Pseudomonas akapageensis]|uniref:RHS repeat domain-containing protein n=1 Tax=Pseudomonas akapageensis TaxID=2609961 RepID=UPI00140A5F4E|nr:RHS repeat-associated core domain-containing protein [Pseudomonas akapageensis]